MSTNLSHNLDIEELISDPNPLWLWDGIAGRIYWANDAGLEFWQTERLSELQDMRFDHAMPALRRLRQLALKDEINSGRDERLVFWTTRDTSHVVCNCIKIAVEGYGELLLLRLKDGWSGEEKKESSDLHAEPDEQVTHRTRKIAEKGREISTKPGDLSNLQDGQKIDNVAIGSTRNMASSDENDVAATLREIARQVRAESKLAKVGEASDSATIKIDDGGRQGNADGDRESGPNSRDNLHGEPQTSIDEVDFLAKISHEIRTPLNSILGFSELMMQERFGAVENKKYAEYISDIHESAELALSLINDMLDLSCMNAGQFDVTLEEVDLNALSRTMLSIMRPQAEKNSINLKVELSPDKLIISAGLRSIKQILLNLLSNAIKFTGPGGDVTLITGALSDEWAFVKVCDTGSGMTEPEIARAMQPYSRLDTTPRHVEGTGLGLPITKALVDANGGVFDIKSEPGEGTEILLKFRRISGV